MKITKIQLREIIREEIQKLNEYLVREGDKLGEILALNLFSDMYKGQKLSEFDDEYKNNKKWMKIEKKYSIITSKLERLVKKQKNRKLTEDEVDEIHNVWYDGSDAYDSVEDSIDFLPSIYDAQIDMIRDII